MIIVTGGAGFIGSNLLRYLNQQGERDLWVVDDLTDGTKFVNLLDTQISHYMDKDEFLHKIQGGESFGKVDAVLHQGACSDIAEWNGRKMMNDNYSYSCSVLDYCQKFSIPLIYASSAATYGGNENFSEAPEFEKPINVLGFSKLLFDQHVRRLWATQKIQTQIVGLRYFNVYGPNEQHKEHMASAAYRFSQQILETGICRLFEGDSEYASGEQRRDFVYVENVCEVVGWFLKNPGVSGIYNVGTGRSQTFNDVAKAVIDWHGFGQLQYIPFPDDLKGSYQNYTQADLTQLRECGCDVEFMDVASGVTKYLDRLADKK